MDDSTSIDRFDVPLVISDQFHILVDLFNGRFSTVDHIEILLFFQDLVDYFVNSLVLFDMLGDILGKIGF